MRNVVEFCAEVYDYVQNDKWWIMTLYYACDYSRIIYENLITMNRNEFCEMFVVDDY